MRYAAWAGSWRATLALVGAVTLVRLGFLLADPFALIEDEAHYWEWSRHPGLSYYSKGPGIAWLIWSTTGVLGDTALGVRAGAVIAAAVAALAIAGLARDLFRDGRCGFFAAAVFQLIPVFQGVSVLMTIDGPYLACWALACWAGWRALMRRDGAAWLGLGAALGAGLLFKYTIVLLIPGLALFAWWKRGALRPAPAWGVWALGGVLIALAGLAPIAIWNARHDWATVRHLLGHAGLAGGDVAPGDDAGFNPVWALEFVGVQAGLVGPALVLMSASIRRALQSAAGGHGRGEASEGAAPGSSTEPGLGVGLGAGLGAAFCLSAAAPILAFYFALSWTTRAEGNWPIAGYVTLCAASGWGVVSGMTAVRARQEEWGALPPGERPRAGAFRRRPELARQVSWHWSVGWGLIAALGLMGAAVLRHVPVVGEWIPIGRLRGAPVLAASVDAQRGALRARTGLEPFVIAQHYGRASQLAYYLPDRPVVHCSSSLQHGRRTQYDEWEHTDLRRAGVRASLSGRPAVLLGADADSWSLAFDRVEPLGVLAGEHKRDRAAFLGFGFRGWGDPAEGDTP